MSKFAYDQDGAPTDGTNLWNTTRIGMTDELGQSWWGGGHFAGRVPLAEAIELLDWEPVEYPVTYEAPLMMDDAGNFVGGNVTIEGKKAIVNPRNGKALGIFADSYSPHPYREALLDNLATILDAAAGELHIGSVGCLGHGEQAWVQVRPAEGVTVGGDKILPWICAYSSLDGSLATSYKPCRTRIVCDNTLAGAATERTMRYRIRHTKYSKLKLAEARDIIGIMWAETEDFAAEVERLMATDITNAQFARVLDIIAPVAAEGASARAVTMADNKRQAIASYYVSRPDVAPYHGTAWGVLQAANGYMHHGQSVRNVSRTDRQALNTITGKVDEHDHGVLAAIGKVLTNV